MPEIDRRTKRGKDLAMRLNRQTVLDNMPKVWYIEEGNRYRVGRTDWQSDQFNVMDKETFLTFVTVLRGLNFEAIDVTHNYE